jgi:hypothetical protein
LRRSEALLLRSGGAQLRFLQCGASGKGATQKAAEAQALDACKGRCKIVVSDCN